MPSRPQSLVAVGTQAGLWQALLWEGRLLPLWSFLAVSDDESRLLALPAGIRTCLAKSLEAGTFDALSDGQGSAVVLADLDDEAARGLLPGLALQFKDQGCESLFVLAGAAGSPAVRATLAELRRIQSRLLLFDDLGALAPSALASCLGALASAAFRSEDSVRRPDLTAFHSLVQASVRSGCAWIPDVARPPVPQPLNGYETAAVLFPVSGPMASTTEADPEGEMVRQAFAAAGWSASQMLCVGADLVAGPGAALLVLRPYACEVRGVPSASVPVSAGPVVAGETPMLLGFGEVDGLPPAAARKPAEAPGELLLDLLDEDYPAVEEECVIIEDDSPEAVEAGTEAETEEEQVDLAEAGTPVAAEDADEAGEFDGVDAGDEDFAVEAPVPVPSMVSEADEEPEATAVVSVPEADTSSSELELEEELPVPEEVPPVVVEEQQSEPEPVVVAELAVPAAVAPVVEEVKQAVPSSSVVQPLFDFAVASALPAVVPDEVLKIVPAGAEELDEILVAVPEPEPVAVSAVAAVSEPAVADEVAAIVPSSEDAPGDLLVVEAEPVAEAKSELPPAEAGVVVAATSEEVAVPDELDELNLDAGEEDFEEGGNAAGPSAVPAPEPSKPEIPAVLPKAQPQFEFVVPGTAAAKAAAAAAAKHRELEPAVVEPTVPAQDEAVESADLAPATLVLPPPALPPLVPAGQGSLNLKTFSRGIFDSYPITLCEGLDLDTPTYLRQGLTLLVDDPDAHLR